jgi:hypothetical protein
MKLQLRGEGMRKVLVLFLAALFSTATAQQTSLPSDLPDVRITSVRDVPNDAGGEIYISWEVGESTVLPDSLLLLRRVAGGTEGYEVVGAFDPVSGDATDSVMDDGVEYEYSIVPVLGGVPGDPLWEMSASSSAQWINSGRIGALVILIILSVIILWFIETGKRGRKLYIREIGGLSAVEDAVGRATEMGRPVMYIPGIMDMDDIQTIASMVILGRVARKTAEYGSALIVPTSRSIVMSVAQEVVREGYLKAGRPDAYQKENISYITDDQFGYAAGVDGIMVREKPAAIFLLGTFYAESLILAETGRSVGAIQIAGTAMPSQIPFFVAACDYTLIGEELFAASAYLAREPKLLGSLKGQDMAKLFFICVIIIGTIAATIGDVWEPAGEVAAFLRRITHVE